MKAGDSELAQDLVAALNFVSKRIEAEADLAGQPLDDDERALLHDLPTQPVTDLWLNPDFQSLVPRDLAYEKLCSIAKAAYRADLSMNPERSAEWEFAAAVSKLHGHPMAWLLKWGGVEVPKPSWDKWLLLIAALLIVAVGLTCVFLADGQPRTSARFIVAVSIALALLLTICFAPRRVERLQLKQTIANCRRAPAGQIVSPN